jgi:hypothetical protein
MASWCHGDGLTNNRYYDPSHGQVLSVDSVVNLT